MPTFPYQLVDFFFNRAKSVSLNPRKINLQPRPLVPKQRPDCLLRRLGGKTATTTHVVLSRVVFSPIPNSKCTKDVGQQWPPHLSHPPPTPITHSAPPFLPLSVQVTQNIGRFQTIQPPSTTTHPPHPPVCFPPTFTGRCRQTKQSLGNTANTTKL